MNIPFHFLLPRPHTRESQIFPKISSRDAQYRVDPCANRIRTESLFHNLIEPPNDNAKLVVCDQRIENLRIEVCVLRIQVSRDEVISFDAYDSRFLCFACIGLAMGIRVRETRMLRTPFKVAFIFSAFAFTFSIFAFSFECAARLSLCTPARAVGTTRSARDSLRC